MKEIRTPEGIKFQFPDPKDHIAKYMIRNNDWYERDLLEDIRKRTEPGQVAVDVGAHIGNHSLWMARVCGLRVWAFEPNEGVLDQLRSNLALNKVRLRVWTVALGREESVARLIEPKPHNTGANFLELDEIGTYPVTRLDNFLLTNMGRVSVLKIDVEGMEADVLAGGRTLIEKDRPLIYAEAKTREAKDAIEDELPKGYECFGKFAITPVYGYAHP